MTIRVHIERLVLDGVNVGAGDAPRVQAAVEAELSRLVSAGGLAPALRASTNLAVLPAGDVHLDSAPNPSRLGTQIAQSVYQGIGTGEAKR